MPFLDDNKILFTFSIIFLMLIANPVLSYDQIYENRKINNPSRFIVWDRVDTGEIICDFFCMLGFTEPIEPAQELFNITYTAPNSILLQLISDTITNMNEFSQGKLTIQPYPLENVIKDDNLTHLSGYYNNPSYALVKEPLEETIVYVKFQIFNLDAGIIDRMRISSFSYETDENNSLSYIEDSYNVKEIPVIMTDIYADKNITVMFYIPADKGDYINIFLDIDYKQLVDVSDAGWGVRIRDFHVFTFDDVLRFPAEFTSSYANSQCNSSSIALSKTLGNIYPAGSKGILKIQYYTTGTPYNEDCIVYQFNETVVTRRLLNYHYEQNDRQHWNSRDIGVVGIGDLFDCKDCLLLTQVDNAIIEATCIDTGTRGLDTPTLNYSISGVVTLDDIYDLCIAESSGYKYRYSDNSLVGETFTYHRGSGLADSIELDLYRFTCSQEQSCLGSTLYLRKTNCDFDVIVECGVLGCNDASNNCDYPIDINGTIRGEGQFCEDDFIYTTVSLVDGITYNSCEYPDMCYQITSNTIECLLESEYDTFLEQSSSTSFIGSKIGEVFGSEDAEQNMMILAYFIIFIVSIGITNSLKAGSNAIVGFGVSFLALFFLFFFIGWIPFEHAFIVILGIGLFFLVTFRNIFTGSE